MKTILKSKIKSPHWPSRQLDKFFVNDDDKNKHPSNPLNIFVILAVEDSEGNSSTEQWILKKQTLYFKLNWLLTLLWITMKT